MVCPWRIRRERHLAQAAHRHSGGLSQDSGGAAVTVERWTSHLSSGNLRMAASSASCPSPASNPRQHHPVGVGLLDVP